MLLELCCKQETTMKPYTENELRKAYRAQGVGWTFMEMYKFMKQMDGFGPLANAAYATNDLLHGFPDHVKVNYFMLLTNKFRNESKWYILDGERIQGKYQRYAQGELFK